VPVEIVAFVGTILFVLFGTQVALARLERIVLSALRLRGIVRAFRTSSIEIAGAASINGSPSFLSTAPTAVQVGIGAVA
jgi:hypothetical protein